MNLPKSAKATMILLVLVVSFSASVLLVSPHGSNAVTSSNIVITSNADFMTCKCVTGGTGTASNPYIISGLRLYSTTGPGILVNNTSGQITDHFELIDDTVTNSSSTTTNYAGVEFVNLNGLGQITGSKQGNLYDTFKGNKYGFSSSIRTT